MRHNIILSTLVDNTILSEMPDVRVTLFPTIEAFSEYIEHTPIRAEELYITKDVLGVSTNSSLDKISRVLLSSFFRVDTVIYLTEKDSPELQSVNYLISEFMKEPDSASAYNRRWNITEWKTEIGSLRRDYFTDLILGNLRKDGNKPRRKNVYAVKAEDYIKAELFKKSAEDKFSTEEEDLRGIEAVPQYEPDIHNTNTPCRTVTISGLNNDTRHLFTSLLAQYCSLVGKTIVIERDFDYLSLTNLMTNSDLDFTVFTVKQLYENPSYTINLIRKSQSKLILLTDPDRLCYSYMFISNIIYNNLEKDIKYLVLEQNFNEVSPSTEYVTVIENNVPSLLETIENLPPAYSKCGKFVLLNTRSYQNTSIPNTEQALMIIQDLLQNLEVDVQIFNTLGTKLGGEHNGISVYIE